MDFRVNVNSDNLDAIIQKMEQQRLKSIARLHSMNSTSPRSEDYFTLSNYAIEFKDFKGMLEEEPGIRKDEAAKSKKNKKGKSKTNSKKNNGRSPEGHIDHWG